MVRRAAGIPARCCHSGRQHLGWRDHPTSHPGRLQPRPCLEVLCDEAAGALALRVVGAQLAQRVGAAQVPAQGGAGAGLCVRRGPIWVAQLGHGTLKKAATTTALDQQHHSQFNYWQS